MSKVYIIRPFLKYQSGAENSVSPEEAVKMIDRCEWATVGSRNDLVKTMRLLGFSPDELAFSITYGLYGSPPGLSSSVL